MLKCEIKRGGEVRVEAEGSFCEIVSEVCCLIDGLYDTIRKRDRAAAEAFRAVLTDAMTDKDTLMWKDRDYGAGAVQACVVTRKKGGAEPPPHA